MFKLGLTGGIGSGKSLVADILQSQGASVIDTDKVAHELTGPAGRAMPAIREAFGEQVVRADGAMDRDQMRARVFSEPAARKTLEMILHPMIRDQVAEQISEAKGLYVVLVVPLLIESGRWRDRVDRVCVVDCDRDTQIARVTARNGLPLAQIESILAVQASREQRLAHADDVVINDGQTTRESVHAQVLVLHRLWCNLAGC